jgi:gamma-glutamylcyclotransferase (GGCT)/AIG2-like uncharacterized protein YtfP
MKIIITENKVEKLKELIKTQETNKTIKQMGGWDNFCQVFKIEGPMDFLHLFDDLEQVQSEKKENWTLFWDKKGNYLMVYDRKSKEVYINNVEIWSFLSNKFDLTYPVIQGVTKKWLGEVYNLRGITTNSIDLMY